jgi:hypothetical protein
MTGMRKLLIYGSILGIPASFLQKEPINVSKELKLPPLFSWMWSAGSLGKHKFFSWLLLKDRLNTRNLLRRKNMYLDDYNCAICNSNVEETCMHLFFECPFSLSCWNHIGIHWDFSLPPLDMLIEARTNFGSPIFRERFSSLPAGRFGILEMG